MVIYVVVARAIYAGIKLIHIDKKVPTANLRRYGMVPCKSKMRAAPELSMQNRN